MYQGGTDTVCALGISIYLTPIAYAPSLSQTVCTILNFVLAMLDHPKIMERAQAELDSILNPGQWPGFDDEERLPYVTAVVKETMRYMPVTPLVSVILSKTELC